MTTDLRPAFVKRIADFGIFELLNLWMRVGLLHPLNKAAKHYGVAGFDTMFEYWRGDLNLVAEPPDLTGAELPDDYHFIGPVIARQDFPIPRAVLDLPHDLPLVYFAMGSSGTPEIVARVVEGFADQPYQVVAPVRSMLGHVDDVHVPDNVLVTDWLPALEVNRMADISVIHGGIGTVMTAALAGKPIVGVGMQPEQTANLAAIARHGFAIRVPKSTDPSDQILEAARRLLADDDAKRAARDYAESLAQWNGPANAARLLVDSYGTA
jgi:UDP:flavonoid glycosyltransferase YjiC (YdhE family)